VVGAAPLETICPRLLLATAVAFIELVYLAGSIECLLLAGIERAHILAFGGSGREAVAAAAGHVYLLVLWVDFRFHYFAALIWYFERSCLPEEKRVLSRVVWHKVASTAPVTSLSENGQR